MAKQKISTPITILGAGPGGAFASLVLSKNGIKHLLVDKANFPRDKICGDAISGKVVDAMKRIDPNFVNDFEKANVGIACYGVEFVAPNLSSIKLPFKKNFPADKEVVGFISKRIDFDNYLIEKAKQSSYCEFIPNCNIDKHEKTALGWALTDSNYEFEINSMLVIAANGAHSQFAKKIGGMAVNPQHYCAGLRAYYKNVNNLSEHNFIELHFLKEFLPGYFWIFPLANGEANIGVGMRSDYVSKHRINLKEEMLKIINYYPSLKSRFEGATLVDGIKGYGLPLGSKKRKISGNGYMLVGDAASLIDPFTGEGIGNAIWSGEIAAHEAIKCLENNNFSAANLAAYDEKVYLKLWDELSASYKMQQLINYPWLFNWIVKKANTNQLLRDTLMAMFDEVEVRNNFKKPSFYFKLLFSGK
jgi:geranylgeranyl reductase family protein